MEARDDVTETMLALVSLSLISAMIGCASDDPCNNHVSCCRFTMIARINK